MDMPLFILGVVIGGLSLWIFMRERVLRLEAQIEAALTKKKVEAADSPAVKKRKVGEGGSKATKEAVAEESEAEESEAEEAEEAEESEAEESDAEESDAESAEADAKKKPKVDLKIPEPSSVSEVSSAEDE